MKVTDTHSHFNLHQFEQDREDAIARMEVAGVNTICIGIDTQTSTHAVELAHAHSSIWACVGQHPTEWSIPFDDKQLDELCKKDRVVAVGECGLDYYRERDREMVAVQKELFLKQIELAHRHDLPLMLHIRPEQGTPPAGGGAYEEALDMLESYKRQWPTIRGTAHFFVGTKEIAQRFLDLDFYISFSGVITIFPEYEDIVRYVPIDRILPETDAPFAAPVPYRGKRCEPQYVLETIKKIAEIKGLSIEETQAKLLENTKKLFRLG